MIIATAGHVDHGKTTLVRALTGTDPTRHAEARERGMTIDLGFATIPARTAGEPAIALVDVPGHERFLRNMICGIAGVDAALLVIAADEGPMPQTLEHLRVLDLLGIDRGVVALTRIDRCDAAQRTQVRTAISALAHIPLIANAPIVEVCALDGRGVDVLRDRLESLSRSTPSRRLDQRFRLAVDRSFSLAGIGLVVTGTVFSGELATGDPVHALHAAEAARVRGIQIQHRRSDTARAGERCALNLGSTSLNPETISRGEWLVSSGDSPVSKRLHVRLRAIEGIDLRSFQRSRQNLRLHLGSCEVGARMSLIAQQPEPVTGLSTAHLSPPTALVQLLLDRPMGAASGDRFILRDPAAQRTLGGGIVIDSSPVQRLPAGITRAQWLQELERPDLIEALCGAASLSPQGIDLDMFCNNRNIDRALVWARARNTDLVMIRAAARMQVFSKTAWSWMTGEVSARLAQWHATQPESAGMPARRLMQPFLKSLALRLAEPIVERLIEDGVLAHSPIGPRLPDHQPRFAATDEQGWLRIETELKSGGLRTPSALDIARRLKLPRHHVVEFLIRATRLGRVIQVSDSRFFLPDALQGCEQLARDLACATQGALTAAQLRDVTGLGRNLCIELLEYFDRQGLSRREGDIHRWVGFNPGSESKALIHHPETGD